MDRPMGPRQPPDKRHVAYEAIFQRPGVAHHVPSQSVPHYPPPVNPSFHFPQQPQPPQDRRTSLGSFSSGYSGNGYHSPQQLPPGTYRQSYYPSPSHIPQHLAPPGPYDQQPPGPYGYPPPGVPRARSVISNSHSPGIIAPNPDQPPEANPQGLTPAQAYQAQVYNNSASGPPPEWNRYRTSPTPPDRNSNSFPHSQNGSPASRPPHYQDLPRLGINLDQDDGRLGIDFNGSSNSSDEGSSELPWARNERIGQNRPRSSCNQHWGSSDGSTTLHVDTNAAALSVRSSIASVSPISSAAETSVTHPNQSSSTSHLASRRSSDSARTMPKLGGSTPRRERSTQERSMSMSAATGPPSPSSSSRTQIEQKRSTRPFPSVEGLGGRYSPHPPKQHRPRKTPIVYPALLSRVAEAFRERIPLGDRAKDGLTYKEAFDGREAVDKIAYIIKTTDRNLALLLGRALDAQKFFHDVTYDHRLRDSPNELYQFRTKLGPYVSGELGNPDILENDEALSPTAATGQEKVQEAEEIPLPSGVFTLLTDCYSPTCSRDQLCYSIACPRRLEQQARLNMKPQPGLSKQISKESLIDLPEVGTLWIHSVPQEIVNSVSETEKKRQEAINEVIYTERDFVRDLEYLRDTWMLRLQESEVIPPDRRNSFIQQVFWNVRDILAVNTRLRDALGKRQKSYAVVDRIGDVFLDHVPHFGPFVAYGAHQLYGKYEFEREKGQNPAFSAFVEATERLPESRKLELNAFLTKPTTRLARYPLLLETVLKHTPDDSSDKTMIPKVVAMIKEFLANVNAESGKTENRFNLMQLDGQLIYKPGEEIVDLRLKEPGRELIYKGGLMKRDGEILVFLFDHAILFAKGVKSKGHESLRVYRRPIPLELLSISFSDDLSPANGTIRSRRQTGGINSPARNDAKGQYWISFYHLGRKSYSLVLWANSILSQKKWVESIQRQQVLMTERSCYFDEVVLSEGFFAGPNKVNCAAPFSNGRRVVYGTDDGVYISDLREMNREPVKVLSLLEVSQVDVLEDYQLLIVLSERQVITFPLDALDPRDPMAGLKRAKRVSSHTSFFKAGYCLGRVLVCIVKSSQLSSTFKALEPIDQNVRGRSKPTFKKLLQGGNDTLKPFREFYIPVESTSIHYLKTKMCVGCSRGFEIVDLETLETQGLLDPEDETLEFVRKRENLRPMALYRIQNEFLLCYDEFAFYVNKSGQRARSEFMVFWEGQPTGFALREPYILAFEPNFVEIRHIETGYLAQVIQGSNLRLLFADAPPTSSLPKGGMINPPGGPQGMPGPGMQQYGGHAGYGGYSHGHGHGQQMYHNHGGSGGGGGYSGGGPGGRMQQTPGRDEILVCSDDRVFALKPAAAAMSASTVVSGATSGSVGSHSQSSHTVLPDNGSWSSIPR
ncbi:Rho1 guanine nucleotide exchange factor 1 [Leucoagaricus sp. SymC.cos]|nr:Rho1 guanine nucleotide exchange factor 1 [Leucoagaricus sp. SymC.cos]